MRSWPMKSEKGNPKMTNNLFDYPFLDDAHYLVACTYGPDSMALLDMMMKANVKPIVCFVNYHTGNDCEEAEQKMRLFCQEHDLSLEVCDTNFVPQDGRDDDFEAWSRKTRYDFFKEIYVKYDAAALFIAHQQDDLIETYLLGKQNGVTKSRYGVGKISTYQGMMVVRPLLDFTSADLHHYCHENNVPFLPDMSNFEDLHTRNKIRHEVIDKLTEIERGQILDEMRRVNDDKIGFVKGLDQQIKIGEELNIREILALSPDDYAGTLTAYINKKSPIRIAVTPTMLSAIRKMCVDPQSQYVDEAEGQHLFGEGIRRDFLG
jgi:tRNA(Ile)-lysidine synthetase-like protein